MGSYDYENRVRAKSAKEAFSQAVDAARWEHGNGGYTGTIAEKYEFVMCKPEPGETPTEAVERMRGEEEYQDKWGPANCVDMGDGTFTFFGTASS